MSHTMGYYYFEYRYHAPWTAPNGQSGVYTEFHTAYYSQYLRVDHKQQGRWRNSQLYPTTDRAGRIVEDGTIKYDVERFFRSNPNRKWKAFSAGQVEVISFRVVQTLPITTTGRNEGMPYGVEVPTAD